jgi:hypothetical protein
MSRILQLGRLHYSLLALVVNRAPSLIWARLFDDGGLARRASFSAKCDQLRTLPLVVDSFAIPHRRHPGADPRPEPLVDKGEDNGEVGSDHGSEGLANSPKSSLLSSICRVLCREIC